MFTPQISCPSHNQYMFNFSSSSPFREGEGNNYRQNGLGNLNILVTECPTINTPGILIIWLHPCWSRIIGLDEVTGEEFIVPKALLAILPLTLRFQSPPFPMIRELVQFPPVNLNIDRYTGAHK